MTHTKGKWVIREHTGMNGNPYISFPLYNGHFIKDNINGDGIALCKTLSNAERIVQMNNSYDELLEACKDWVEYFKGSGVSAEALELLENMKSAIAKAEGE